MENLTVNKRNGSNCTLPVYRDQRRLQPQDQQQQQEQAQEQPTKNRKPPCSHCGSRTLHQKMDPPVGQGKRNCPFKDHSKEIAEKAQARVNLAASANGVEKFTLIYIQPHLEVAIAEVGTTGTD